VGRSYRFLAPSTAICIVYKTKTKPWSIGDGHVGDNNHVIINPGTEHEVIQGGSYNHMETGDVLVNNTGGGGGYGHPYDREPDRVCRDVRNGFVSVQAAAADYGVAVDADTLEVDQEATTAFAFGASLLMSGQVHGTARDAGKPEHYECGGLRRRHRGTA